MVYWYLAMTGSSLKQQINNRNNINLYCFNRVKVQPFAPSPPPPYLELTMCAGLSWLD